MEENKAKVRVTVEFPDETEPRVFEGKIATILLSDGSKTTGCNCIHTSEKMDLLAHLVSIEKVKRGMMQQSPELTALYHIFGESMLDSLTDESTVVTHDEDANPTGGGTSIKGRRRKRK